MVPRVLAAVMGLAVRRPAAVAGAVLALAVAAGLLALRLEPSTGLDTLVGRATPGHAATQTLHRRFGDDAVYVLVRESAARVALTDDLGRVLGLEGCLSGNVPQGVAPPGGARGPCARLARSRSVKVVFGPGTFLNEAVGQISDQLRAAAAGQTREAASAGRAAYRRALRAGLGDRQARVARRQAREAVAARFYQELLALALRYGLTSAPSLDDPRFVARVVFDDRKPAGTPKARLASIFPGRDGALIHVRLRHGLSEARRRAAIADVRAATRMPQWRLSRGDYAVTGAPVVLEELSASLGSSIAVLLAVALIVMALTLPMVFRARLRLLPLLVALAATAMTFGVTALVGVPLTMASIAVIPVLIGLAVDYAIQIQSRIQESGPPLSRAARQVARRGAPTIAVAGAATAAGFLVLVLSPVPMVRGFGVLLVVGIALALGCALTLGIAAQALADKRSVRAREREGDAAASMPGAARRGARARTAALRSAGALGAAWRGAGQILAGSRAAVAAARLAGAAGRPVRAVARRALGTALARPGRVVAVAAALAALGWALDTQTRVESDVQRLVPQDLVALRDLRDLQRISGVGGEVSVLVEGSRVTDPEVVAWMTDYQARVLKRLGFTSQRGCGRADICPALSLPDLFTTKASLASRRRVESLLDAVPPYFSQSVIASDRRAATLSFGLRLMPLDRQVDVLRTMRSELDPPPGVRARLAGLPVLAAEAHERIASPWRRATTLVVGLLAVALVLLAALRSLRRAFLPLVPIVLATGWSALVLFALRIPLNPMSLVLGALVIAIATEFSVLLGERYRAERADGHGVERALRRTYRSTGAAVLASGVTAIAGFAVLVVSDVRMLRDFGFVTVADLAVALVGVLVVLPAVLVLAERRAAAPARADAGLRGRLATPARGAGEG